MREAQKRSRGLVRFHTLRSATCGPLDGHDAEDLAGAHRPGAARASRHDESLDELALAALAAPGARRTSRSTSSGEPGFAS